MKDVLLNLREILPELLIAATLLCVLLSELLFGGDEEYNEVRSSDTLALTGIAVALAVVLLSFKACVVCPQNQREIFYKTLSIDPFSQFVKILLLATAFIAVLFSYQTPEVVTPRRSEYYSYLLGLLLGGMFLASANDILMFYLSFEMVGVSSYILAGHMKGSLRSSEAGYKYVLYGAASSGVLLYGLSFFYGMSGTTYLPDVFNNLASQFADAYFPGMVGTKATIVPVTMKLLPIPFFMVLVGLLYKIAAFPFHFWAPDVYEGSPMPVTALFSVLVKTAGFSALIRFVYCFALTLSGVIVNHTGGSVQLDFSLLTNILAITSVVTMTLGNFAALNQTNVKRLLAYSGIANAGYLLMGVSVLLYRGETGGVEADGVFAVLFYLTVYLFANLGAFVVAIAIHDHLGKEEIEEYAGLGRLAPFMGVSMAIFLFSLVGLPPLAGFVGKFYLFAAVVRHNLFWLALVGLLNSVVSLFYYMRILKAMFFTEAPAGTAFSISHHYQSILWMLVLPVLGLGVYFEPLARMARTAARYFVGP